jgi:hypothetical protein
MAGWQPLRLASIRLLTTTLDTGILFIRYWEAATQHLFITRTAGLGRLC